MGDLTVKPASGGKLDLRNNGGTAKIEIPDSGNIDVTGGIVETGGVLKENLLTNSGFDVWSNSTLVNPTTGSAPALGDAGDLIGGDGEGTSMSNWTDNSGSGSSVIVSGGHFEFDGVVGYARLTTKALAVTTGKLYLINYKVEVSGHTSDEIKVSTASSTIRTWEGVEHALASTGVKTLLWESTYTGNVYVTFKTGYSALELDNIFFHEVTPGCVASDDKGPDGWTKLSATDIWRQHTDATYTKDGSFYALKMLSSGNTNGDLRYTISSPELERYLGRTVTIGAWVKTDAASQVKLNLLDSTGSNFSGLNTGTGWEWLEVTATISTSTTYVAFYVFGTNTKTIYISQPMLVFGSSIGEGNYTRPQGEWVYFEKQVNSRKFYSTGFSDVATSSLYLSADSNGAIPRGAKAVHWYIEGRDSASAGTDVYFLTRSTSTAGWTSGSSPAGRANDTWERLGGTSICNSDGNIEANLNASGSGTFDCYLTYKGVQLH